MLIAKRTLFIFALMTPLVGEGYNMGRLHETVSVDVALNRVRHENAYFHEYFKAGIESFRDAAKEAEENFEENLKKVEPLVKAQLARRSYSTSKKLHRGSPVKKTLPIPLGKRFPIGKKLIFFDAKDEISAYMAVRWARSNMNSKEKPIGFCANWDKESIDRFIENTGGKFIFQAMENDHLMEEFGIEKVPAVITIKSLDEVEVQYGL